MKTPILISLFSAVAAVSAYSDDYSVFRVCQDQRVIRTSDGAEAGHVEYIVVDPASRQVISTVVSGGVVGDRFVAVPYESLRFNGGREITLNEITRERLVSAPPIERTQISAAVIAPTIIQRTTNYFSVRTDINGGRDAGPGARGVNSGEDPRQRGEAAARNEASARSAAAGQNQPPGARSEEGREAQAPAARTNGRGAKDPNARENAGRNAPAANAENNAARPERNGAQTPAGQSKREQQPNSKSATGEKEPNTPDTGLQQKNESATREHSKAAAAKRDAENANPQQDAEKRETQGAAERKAAEATAHSRKPAEGKENGPAENATKHAPKSKAQEPGGEDKRKEDSSPR